MYSVRASPVPCQNPRESVTLGFMLDAHDRPSRLPAHDPARWRAHSHLLRSEEHTSELQSPRNLVCRLLLEKKQEVQGVIQQIHEQSMNDEGINALGVAAQAFPCRTHRPLKSVITDSVITSFFFFFFRPPYPTPPLLPPPRSSAS